MAETPQPTAPKAPPAAPASEAPAAAPATGAAPAEAPAETNYVLRTAEEAQVWLQKQFQAAKEAGFKIDVNNDGQPDLKQVKKFLAEKRGVAAKTVDDITILATSKGRELMDIAKPYVEEGKTAAGKNMYGLIGAVGALLIGLFTGASPLMLFLMPLIGGLVGNLVDGKDGFLGGLINLGNKKEIPPPTTGAAAAEVNTSGAGATVEVPQNAPAPAEAPAPAAKEQPVPAPAAQPIPPAQPGPNTVIPVARPLPVLPEGQVPAPAKPAPVAGAAPKVKKPAPLVEEAPWSPPAPLAEIPIEKAKPPVLPVEAPIKTTAPSAPAAKSAPKPEIAAPAPPAPPKPPVKPKTKQELEQEIQAKKNEAEYLGIMQQGRWKSDLLIAYENYAHEILGMDKQASKDYALEQTREYLKTADEQKIINKARDLNSRKATLQDYVREQNALMAIAPAEIQVKLKKDFEEVQKITSPDEIGTLASKLMHTRQSIEKLQVPMIAFYMALGENKEQAKTLTDKKLFELEAKGDLSAFDTNGLGANKIKVNYESQIDKAIEMRAAVAKYGKSLKLPAETIKSLLTSATKEGFDPAGKNHHFDAPLNEWKTRAEKVDRYIENFNAVHRGIHIDSNKEWIAQLKDKGSVPSRLVRGEISAADIDAATTTLVRTDPATLARTIQIRELNREAEESRRQLAEMNMQNVDQHGGAPKTPPGKTPPVPPKAQHTP